MPAQDGGTETKVNKIKLIYLGICLFVVGIRLVIIKDFAKNRADRRIIKGKCVSDKISIILSEKIMSSHKKWNLLEKKYSEIYNLIKGSV